MRRYPYRWLYGAAISGGFPCNTGYLYPSNYGYVYTDVLQFAYVKQPDVAARLGCSCLRAPLRVQFRRRTALAPLQLFKEKGRTPVFARGSGQNIHIIPRSSPSAKRLGGVSPRSRTALHVPLLSLASVLRGQEVSNDHCYPDWRASGLVGAIHRAGVCALHGPPDHAGSSRSASTPGTLVFTAPAAERHVGPVAVAWS